MKITKYFLNIIYFIYIKISSLLYRLIRYLSLRDSQYITLIDDLANHNKDVIMNSDYVTPFRYEILKSIPDKLLYVLVYTENVKTDVLFLMRLYKTIINIPEFIALGNVKIVLVCTYGEDMITLSTSYPIKSTTSPQDFISHFFKSFIKLTLKGYSVESFDILLVKSFTGDKSKTKDIINNAIPVLNSHKSIPISNNQKRLYSTHSKSTTVRHPTLQNHEDFVADNIEANLKDARRFILPLQPKGKQLTKIAVFDIETFVLNGKLYPYAIGLQYAKYNKIHKIMYYYEDIHDSVENNSAAILEKMVDHMLKNCKHYTIFAHNLGKFDGILMMASIFNVLGPHSVIIGKDNSIITMSFKGMKLLDSLRIFPMSLRALAKQFEVNTQKGEFDYEKVNHSNVTNDLIKSEVLTYLEGDISSLYECMMKASDYIYTKCKFNISDVYSASSLAMKHFRTSYLDLEGIPLVPKHLTNIISEAYFGGISQVYKSYGRNLYYYDINSLYPWAMTQDMPYEYLGISYKPKLEDCFGFIYASIFVPSELNYKPLPVRMEDILATPSGHILGIYFSEELKYAESIGCQITVHKAYLYSRKQIFNQYVADLYAEKAVAKGPNRVFIKLLLNGLYGFFARNNEKYVAIFLPLDEAIKEIQIYPAYNLILMDDDQTALLIREVQPSKELCETTGHKFTEHFDIHNKDRTKSNRAIAAAITGYSRIRIHQFKDICGDVYYSDTDSIITSNKLDEKYLNNELGMMKDEFKGQIISEGIFISPKLYGLRLDNGKEIIKARGVPEGILNFDTLIKIQQGEEITFKRKLLFKSLNSLSILDKEIAGSVKLQIPSGKEAILDNKGKITGYKDIHQGLIKALNENPIGYKLSNKISNLIKNYKIRMNNRFN
jgi:hypothetical protein